jgi:hypothetical protein
VPSGVLGEPLYSKTATSLPTTPIPLAHEVPKNQNAAPFDVILRH